MTCFAIIVDWKWLDAWMVSYIYCLVNVFLFHESDLVGNTGNSFLILDSLQCFMF